jgi:hypothetical protein
MGHRRSQSAMRNSGSFATLGIKFTSSDLSWFFQSSLPLRINSLSCPCAAQDCRRRGLGRQGRNTLASRHAFSCSNSSLST